MEYVKPEEVKFLDLNFDEVRRLPLRNTHDGLVFAQGVKFNSVEPCFISECRTEAQNPIMDKRMSSLASAVGMNVDLVNEEIRSLMSGDISTDSKSALILFGSPKQERQVKKTCNRIIKILSRLEKRGEAPTLDFGCEKVGKMRKVKVKGKRKYVKKFFKYPTIWDYL
ncbi:hypothetical protein TPMD03_19 [Thiohalocapsa phage LS06-2018-MD03]|nr:hypothetical protein TPMD03_19 [Thiohalocapsa phage LS06-2018-MD03]